MSSRPFPSSPWSVERPDMADPADALPLQDRVAVVLAVCAIVGAWAWLVAFVGSR